LVVEVLYVEHCPNFPAALALVERVAADLGVDAGELAASTPWSVACTGMSIAWPATPGALGP
jgi:hypothetical protein